MPQKAGSQREAEGQVAPPEAVEMARAAEQEPERRAEAERKGPGLGLGPE